MKSSNANRKRGAPVVVAAVAILMILVIIKLLSISPPEPVQRESVVPTSTTNVVAAPVADTGVTQMATAQTVVPPEPEKITAGALQGTVTMPITDSTIDPLPGVTVKATVAGESAYYDALTDTEGRYRIEHMAPGTYDLEFSLEHMAPTKYANIGIRSAVLLNVDAQMQLDVTQVFTIVHPVMKRVAGRVPTSIVEPHH